MYKVHATPQHPQSLSHLLHFSTASIQTRIFQSPNLQSPSLQNPQIPIFKFPISSFQLTTPIHNLQKLHHINLAKQFHPYSIPIKTKTTKTTISPLPSTELRVNYQNPSSRSSEIKLLLADNKLKPSLAR